MRATAYQLRAFLRYAYAQAVASSVTLVSYLTTLSSSSVTGIKDGSQIQSVSTNGHSTSFSFNGLNPVDVADLLEYLHTLREDVYVQLGGTPTDAQVYAEMMYQLQPVTEVRETFGGVA